MNTNYTVKQFRELPIETKVKLTNARLKELKEQGLYTKDFSNETLKMSYTTVSNELAKEGYTLNTKNYEMEYSKEKHDLAIEKQEAEMIEVKSPYDVGSYEERLNRLEENIEKILSTQSNNEEDKNYKIYCMVQNYNEFNKYNVEQDTHEKVQVGVRLDKQIKYSLQELLEKYPINNFNQLVNMICLDFIEKYK